MECSSRVACWANITLNESPSLVAFTMNPLINDNRSVAEYTMLRTISLVVDVVVPLFLSQAVSDTSVAGCRNVSYNLR